MTMPISKVRFVYRSFKAGHSIAVTAREHKVRYANVRNWFRQFEQGRIPDEHVTGPIAATLDRYVKASLRGEARRRQISVYQLVRQLLVITAGDNLYNAVLGEPEDGLKKKSKRDRKYQNRSARYRKRNIIEAVKGTES